MLVAAASWDALAAELASAAENYGSVIARLTGMHWWGPASTSMLAIRGAIVVETASASNTAGTPTLTHSVLDQHDTVSAQM